jgi:DNA-binding NarL/FixJ family response regulator
MPRNRDDSIGFPDLHTQLRIISRLLAAQLRQNTSQQDMVRLLSSTGATNAEIADVLDTTPATIKVTIQRLKKKASGAPKSESADAPVAADTGGDT